MKVLGINTTGVGTQMSLRINENADYIDAGFSKHSETFFPLLENFMDSHNMAVKDLDYIGVVTGPGSFTGIRIGMSVAKAFSYVNNIPCIPVNALMVLAYNVFDFDNVDCDGTFCSAINAGAGLVYYQMFKIKDRATKSLDFITEPNVAKVEHFEGFLSMYYNKTLVLFNQGNERPQVLSYNNIIECAFTPKSLDMCILQQIDEGKMVTQNLVMPLYIRTAQAEEVVISKKDKQEIMPAIKDDLQDLITLESQEDKYDLPWTEQNVNDMFNNERAKTLVYKINNESLGYIVYLDLSGQYEIERVIVLKKARLRGIAEALLSKLFELAKQNNVNEILLEVNELNYPAYRLYSKLGFEKTGVRKDYYGKNQNAILMTKKI